MCTAQYEQYLLAEWEMFSRNPNRVSASLAAVGSRKITRVLDVGCGAGQELIPYVVKLSALGIAVDIAPQSARVGGNLFTAHYPAARVVFIRAAVILVPGGIHGESHRKPSDL